MPYEEKTFTQYFMPYKAAGYVKNASADVVLNLDKQDENVSFTDNGDGTYTSSHTHAEIEDYARNKGYAVMLHYSNGQFPLYSVSGSFATFIRVSGNSNYAQIQMFQINANGNIRKFDYTMDSLKNPNALTINGVSYDGSEAINVVTHTAGTEDLTAGVSELETGKLYFVYE
jgi:hypothetical protein